jgi:HEAT repeat protein
MKRFVCAGLFFAAAMVLFAASEDLETYTRLYTLSSTTVERFGIIQNVAEANIADSAEFFTFALDHLTVGYPNLRGNTRDLAAADSAARLLAEKLGDAKHLPAAPSLWRVVESFSNPLARGDAIIALGKMQAVAFLPQIVRILTDLNDGPTPDRVAGEQLAFSTIQALESYQDPSGYIPVFLASAGWYTERARSRAAAALPRILDDPSEPLTELIRSPGTSYPVKYLALQAIENSQVSGDKKAAVAVAAYAEGWRSATNDRQLRMVLVNIRKYAIGMIRRYGTEDAAVYTLLERSYKSGVDEEEKLGAVAALSALATEDSVRLLSSFLADINTKLQDGSLTQVDERLVRAIIPALGATKRSSAASALRAVQTFNWTGAVKRLAADALKNIP